MLTVDIPTVYLSTVHFYTSPKRPVFFASRAANIVAGNNVKLGIFWEKLKSNKRAKGKIC